jgi:hypothetical protein
VVGKGEDRGLAGRAWRSCCERLSGLLQHVMARRREEKGFGLASDGGERKVDFGVD